MKKKNFFSPTVFKLIASLVAVVVFYWLITYLASSCGPETISMGALPTGNSAAPSTTLTPCGGLTNFIGSLLQIPFFIYLASLVLGYVSGCAIGYYFDKPKKAKKK